MDNYIRRAQITSLFEKNQNLKINFEEKINCLYGVNGSGKTTVINILVASLYCDVVKLAAMPFEAVSIYIAPSGKRQAKLFITVEKNDDGQLLFDIHDNKFSEIFNVEIDDFNSKNEKLRSEAVKIIKENVALTYVPLSRMQESDTYDIRRDEDYLLQRALRARHIPLEQAEDILDPSRRMLTELEKEFKKKYTDVQNELNKELEELKDKIASKVLLDRNYVKTVQKSIREFNLEEELKHEDASTYFKKMQMSNINISKASVDEHFKIMDELEKSYNEAREKFNNARKKRKTDELQKEQMEFSDKFSLLFSLLPMYKRFFNIIEEIEVSSNRREKLLRTFRNTEKAINDLLINKKFSFTEKGDFLIKRGTTEIKLNNLSSGEKHMIVLLGRVALSTCDGAVFIADEPELSLHLEWQRKIIPAITELSPKMQVIVATHSPAIIPSESNEIDLASCYK